VNIYRAPMNGVTLNTSVKILFWLRASPSIHQGRAEPGVSATVKHYMGNNSEFDRHNTDSIIRRAHDARESISSIEAAVKEANVGAIMDSITSPTAPISANRLLNTDVAKMSGASRHDHVGLDLTYDGIAAVTADSILEMPSELL